MDGDGVLSLRLRLNLKIQIKVKRLTLKTFPIQTQKPFKWDKGECFRVRVSTLEDKLLAKKICLLSIAPSQALFIPLKQQHGARQKHVYPFHSG